MNKKYAIAILATILVILFMGIASAATTSISVSDTSGSPGSTVKVPINATGASNVGAMTIVLTYDPSILSVTGVEKGVITKNSLFDSNRDTSGIVAIGAADTGGIDGDGSVAIISFNVVCKLGDTSPLKVEIAELNDVDTHGGIIVTKTSGTFTVAESGGLLSWTIIGVIIAAVVVIALAIVLVMRRRKAKATA